MVKSVKLSLAFLSVLSVLALACSRSEQIDPAPGNSNPSTATATGPAANNAVNPAAFEPTAANKYVVPPSPAISNAQTATPADPNAPTATIRAKSVKAIAGRDVTVEIEIASKGDITVMVFSLDFDPNVFTYVSSKISSAAPKEAVLTVNAEQTAAGKFGAIIDSSVAFGVGKKSAMTVVFHVAPDAPARDYPINFSSKPARQSVSTIKTQLVDTKFESATVHVAASR